MALDHLIFWLIAVTQSLLTDLVVAGFGIHNRALPWSVQIDWIVRMIRFWFWWYVAHGIAFQILGFSINLFVLRFRSPLASMLIGFLAAGALYWLDSYGRTLYGYSADWIYWTYCLAVALAGGVLLASGYRYWKRADLD